MKKKILIGIVAVLVIIQFFRIDKSNPEVKDSENLVTMTNAPEEVVSILRESCYDCHSNEVVFPWYSNVAPVSWFVGHHVEEGREHLNFSVWGTYDEETQEHKLEECIEEIEEHEMPLQSYVWMHGDSELNEEQRELLINWMKSL